MVHSHYKMLMATNQSSSPDNEPNRQGAKAPDLLLVDQLEMAILRNAGGIVRFKKVIPLLLRKAIDEVIDSARTNRFTLDETKINERIYLGTKIRVQLRSRLKLTKEKMFDLGFGETEIGIQSTIRETWSVPHEIVGNLCLLVKSDEKRSVCSIGAMVIRDEVLNAAEKPSGRRMISNTGIANIHWILKNEPLPNNSSLCDLTSESTFSFAYSD